MRNYVAKGLKTEVCLDILGLSRHQYYYKSKPGKQGRAPDKTTIKHMEGEKVTVSNEEVVKDIRHNHEDRDLHYGYHKMTTFLQILGFIINHKKVYRLMKAHQLLHKKAARPKKNYARYRILAPQGPLECLEMDIKFVWIESLQRHAAILTILDVFTRATLNWCVAMSITQHTVKRVFNEVVINHLQPHDMLAQGIRIEIRNDNDKRFSATMVQDFFRENYLEQVFTHPYTPQENGHIESFHSILDKSLEQGSFYTLEQLEEYLILFYEKYNNTRLHGSIANLPPLIFQQQWELGNIDRIVKDHKRVKFKLTIPYHQLSGNGSLKGASCLPAGQNKVKKEDDAIAHLQPSVQRSPSVASC